MKNSEAVDIDMRRDRAVSKIQAHLVKKDPDYLPEFERHISEIRDRNVRFWLDRESEQAV
jgi:hypothetical protein